MTTTELPVLFLNDLVVLPGMVVPVELDDAARATMTLPGGRTVPLVRHRF